MSLSPEAIALCAQHYHTHAKGNGCHKCPIRDACVSDFSLSEQNMANWQAKVNQAASEKTMFNCLECWPKLCRCPDRDSGAEPL